MWKLDMSLTAVVLAALSVSTWAQAEDKTANRYPFDPACPWGRLADGRGMVIRCLTEAEAAQLSVAKPNTPATVNAVASADVTKKAAPSDAKPEALEADVVAVTADEGNLDSAKKKLRAARDKYARCVADNGGLSSNSGEVTVRFLVRERGRAEGTEVDKRQGVSDTAARCIAAVVDRRPVGTPEGPAVGAAAVIRITKSTKH